MAYKVACPEIQFKCSHLKLISNAWASKTLTVSMNKSNCGWAHKNTAWIISQSRPEYVLKLFFQTNNWGVPNIFKSDGKWSQLQMCTGWPNSMRVIANHALKCLAQLDTSDSQPSKCIFTDAVIHTNTVLRESQCNTEPMQTQTQRPDRPSPKGDSHGITHNPQLSITHRQQPRHNSLH